jgi:hypothetical protein
VEGREPPTEGQNVGQNQGQNEGQNEGQNGGQNESGTGPGETPWADPPGGDEPEPDWAEQIRSARRDRGAKLREVYSRFADEPTPLDDEADTE